MRIIDYKLLDEASRRKLLHRTETNLDGFIEKVKPIIEEIRQHGDSAMASYSNKFDKSSLEANDIRVTEEEIKEAYDFIPEDIQDSIRYAIDNVMNFHKTQVPEAMSMIEVQPGVFAGEKMTPIDRVALYVPRGKGSFPSTTIMVVVPAVLAKVPMLYLLSPVDSSNKIDPATLVVADMVGVKDIFKAGGALAVAAAAYGTESIPKAYKILGPGSPWLMAAKRVLADEIDPGIKAGPTEAIVLADGNANPEHVALDLLIESEHGSDSSVYLVTPDAALVEKVIHHLEVNLANMEPYRADFCRSVFSGNYGGAIITETMEQAIEFINDYAPEHVQVQTKDPFDIVGKIRNAGEILLGDRLPFSVANYVLGANAVIPTASGARTHAPLAVRDFMKATSIGYVTAEGYEEAARHTKVLAQYEGFNGHMRAVLKPR